MGKMDKKFARASSVYAGAATFARCNGNVIVMPVILKIVTTGPTRKRICRKSVATLMMMVKNMKYMNMMKFPRTSLLLSSKSKEREAIEVSQRQCLWVCGARTRQYSCLYHFSHAENGWDICEPKAMNDDE